MKTKYLTRSQNKNFCLEHPQTETVSFFPLRSGKEITRRDWGEISRTPDRSIDHFHYDVTRAKVSGSCSKDRAQCRAIARKCQKISRSAMSAKASYQVFQKAMCSIAIQIQRNSAWSFFFSIISISEELRRVLLTPEHFKF